MQNTSLLTAPLKNTFFEKIQLKISVNYATNQLKHLTLHH
jgi:hypothetical protein